MTARTLALALAVALSACAAPRPLPHDTEAARAFTQTAREAAVERPGARVCRHVELGISESDLVRGIIVQVKGELVAVRIERAPRFPYSIGGTALAPKAVVWDNAISWTPCL
jgi:hypothetical protein